MILIVEDNEALARTYCRSLANSRLDCRHVGTAGAALEVIRDQKPSLMIVDLGLPDMNGVELMVQARTSGYDGPAIALSGAMDLVDPEKLTPARFDMQLTKPLRLDELTNVVINMVIRWAHSSSSS